ncbi:GGDEF domain-containing protein [Thioalkalivibrio paradoxus]|uniref:diguanylate cyclase n=1 Tax=Thioalkalivibrio paradoxus ARh 1 TaxID=713585 RepID=W0DNV9_9GAMM|nr:GGDEF domain-containing protein [Thioalkalivibrio paradoxus]AHE98570.1 histidine kinase [Thioalkalivibrio paradoxus ARh 1]
MGLSNPYVQVLDIEQTLAELNATVDRLRQERDDLEIALTTAVEHGDAIESQLEMANRQLQAEVQQRRQIERQLRDLVATITQKSRDLELVLQTITEHADQMDLQWLGRYIESESTARQDPLTGLANRRKLDETIASEWIRARRQQKPLAMALCDVDFFKAYNDRYGHQAGDECLQQIGDIFRNQVQREGDLVARYGGEEFVVLLPDTDTDGARRVGDRLLEAVARADLLHEASPLGGRVTLSIGVAATVPRGDDEGQLFAEVDRLLYQAKQQGRNRVVSGTVSTGDTHDGRIRPN